MFLSNNKIFLKEKCCKAFKQGFGVVGPHITGRNVDRNAALSYLSEKGLCWGGAELTSTCLEEPGEGIHASDSLRKQAHDRAEVGEP